MKVLLKSALVFENGFITNRDMLLDGAVILPFSPSHSFDICIDGCAVLPGFCDVHVHLREPGFSYKETIETGSAASARGGYTAVLSMPNLKPAPDTRESLDIQLDLIRRGARIAVIPYGTITKGQLGEELSDMEEMKSDVAAFSDDGRGVQSEDVMRSAMLEAKRLGKKIVAHCEDNSLLRGGYIHDGEYARAHGHLGICSESEWGQIKRDLALVRETGCEYHVCHISTAESVALIREAKREGLPVSCETAPHYLTLDDSCLMEDGRFKMNPPLRGKEDRLALIEGIKDGTVDCIATDHAPHSEEEKSRGLAGSLMGVVGIETAFPVLYTDLVRSGVITLDLLTELLSLRPRALFGIDADPGFAVFKLDEEYEIDPDEFLSKGKSTPYLGKRVYGRPIATVYNGTLAYADKRLFDTNTDK